MQKQIKLILLTAILSISSVLPAFAFNVIYAPGAVKNEAVIGPSSVSYILNKNGEYIYNNKHYKVKSYYGTVKLTGYSSEETGTNETYSGKTPVANYTVAAPSDIPIGSVIMIKGTEGPNFSNYDGIHEVQDKGGSTLDDEQIVDIYQNSTKDALKITDNGWNYANIYILEEVNN